MHRIDQTFSALGDRTRVAIIERLALSETALSELAEPFQMSQTAVSKHVKVLESAGLIEIRKQGRTRYCRLQLKPMQEAGQWLEHWQQFWTDNLSNLARYLEEESCS